ncbi:TPA: hypothetical protein I9281_001858 [Serratia marcescens]|uniref:hypothetical protein n=1 Tax=Serratia marcescens TaxID=615 RepID=UPI0002AF4041|nr:hypothetical protein [Serratia marcescens]AGE20042.1 hypothetical protein SMWW4_v1c42550 [Serratia marcescens WW4]HAT4516935.1 hypothetical protein [Serratia marcescens]
MDNKLSELSKPVGYVGERDRKELSYGDCGYIKPCAAFNEEPVYSQEYVSALTQRIAELEKRLATPVRLPLPYSPDPWMSPDPDGTWLDKEDVKNAIRTVGFDVELCSACNERYCGNCAYANGAKVQ